jgi:hypothetical protein
MILVAAKVAVFFYESNSCRLLSPFLSKRAACRLGRNCNLTAIWQLSANSLLFPVTLVTTDDA